MAQGYLDGLAECITTEILKKDCENCGGRISGIRSLREL